MQRLKIAKGLGSPKNRIGLIGEGLELCEKALAKNRTQMHCSAKDRRDLEDESQA